MIHIYNDDCFNVLESLESKSVDLILLDLPYGETECKWDVKIDLERMWNEIKRIRKPTTPIIFFGSLKFGVSLINSNPKEFRYDLIWEKSLKLGFLNAKKMPLRKHELIYIFYKHLPTYNPQKIEGKTYKRKNTSCKQGVYAKERTISIKQSPRDIKDRYPNSVLYFPNPNSKSLHPTQKPLNVLEWLIRTYSNSGDLVLDFCAGSGSVGEACMNLNRECILVEKDPEIYKVMKDRLLKQN